MVKARPVGKMIWDLGTEILIAEDGSYPAKAVGDGSCLQAELTKTFATLDELARKDRKDSSWDAWTLLSWTQ